MEDKEDKEDGRAIPFPHQIVDSHLHLHRNLHLHLHSLYLAALLLPHISKLYLERHTSST